MKSIIIKNGLLLTSSLIIYFAIMKLVGLHYHFELRIFNAVLVIYFIQRAIGQYYQNTKETDYINGFFTGILTNAFAVIIFTILAPLYFYFEPEFLTILTSDGMWGHQLNDNRIMMILMMEGIPSGMIISFITMQYYKSKTVVTN